MANNIEICDCKQGNKIVQCVDGLVLCQDCHNELVLSGGLVCVAWLEREDARRNSQYGDNYQPSGKSGLIRGFGARYERRPGSRRGWWQ